MAGGKKKKGWRKDRVYPHHTGGRSHWSHSISANGKFRDPEYNHIHQYYATLMTLKKTKSKWVAYWQIKFVVDASKTQQIRNNH